MPPSRDSLTDRLAERRSLRFWKRAADAAGEADPETLRALRGRARRMRREIDRLVNTADTRLARPLLGSNAMNRPLGADWLWRPGPWREPIDPRGSAGVVPRTTLAEGVQLFHDCPLREIAYRQLRNTRSSDLAPFGLRLDILGFAGKFLSLALDLPPGAIDGLRRNHIFAAELAIEAERPISIFARLNLEHGPNTAQALSRVPFGHGAQAVEFDLATTSLNEKRVKKIWLDLIFEEPAMNAVTLSDLTMSRRLRADL